MKTQLTTLKRLTLAGALAATMSLGLLGSQPVGTALADGLLLPTDLPVEVSEPALGASESLASDSLQVGESFATDGGVQASGVIVQSVFGR